MLPLAITAVYTIAFTRLCNSWAGRYTRRGIRELEAYLARRRR